MRDNEQGKDERGKERKLAPEERLLPYRQLVHRLSKQYEDLAEEERILLITERIKKQGLPKHLEERLLRDYC